MLRALRALTLATIVAGVFGAVRQRREAVAVRAGTRTPTTPVAPVAAPGEDRLATVVARWRPPRPRTRIGRAAAAVWAAPLTGAGAVLAAAGRGRCRWDPLHGCILAEGIRGPVGAVLSGIGASANTVGQVVLSRHQLTPPALLAHEAAHVRQGERLGPLLLPVYAVLAARYGYRDHPLERAARAVAAATAAA